MSSTFTWLDTSEHDRRRAMEVIDLFQRQTTLDELGIGMVRDALSELLAPALSTIQTRARYFLIVPWVYLSLERRRCPSSDVARRARNLELRVAEALARSDDSGGTIGIQAGRALQRLPSEVYWGGLGALGIRLFSGSREHYHRSLDRFYAAANRDSLLREDAEAEFLGTANWHPHVPTAPEGFLEDLDFRLMPEEARYLQDRFQARAAGSLVAFLTKAHAPLEQARFPWDEPLLSRYPATLRSTIDHAQCFSEVIYGASLLYNLMLSEASQRDDWVADYERRLAEWQALLNERDSALQHWNQRQFWDLVYRSNARIPIRTRHFISRWFELVLDVHPLTVGTMDQRTLIREREARLKPGRARLIYPEYLQMYSGAAGADRLDYRWGIAQTIANDILRGLRTEDTVAQSA